MSISGIPATTVFAFLEIMEELKKNPGLEIMEELKKNPGATPDEIMQKIIKECMGNIGNTQEQPQVMKPIPNQVTHLEWVEEACGNPGCELKILPQDLLKCGRCKSAMYCGPICQKAHWGAHKPDCKAPVVGPKPLATTTADQKTDAPSTNRKTDT